MARVGRPVSRGFGDLKSDVRIVAPTPFVKWAGGKGQLLTQLKAHFPKDYRTFVEPFLGGGAVFFSLQPRRGILSDSNPELINAFLVVRDCPEALMAALDKLHPHREDGTFYSSLRSVDPNS